MSLVDTVMVGRLPNPASAMAAAALAAVLFNTVAIGVGGILLGLDALIAQAFGAEDVPAANRWLWHGLVTAVGLAVLLTGIFLAAPLALRHMPVDPTVLAGAIPALRGLIPGVLPLLVYFALRRYLQAAHQARPIAIALITANAVNIAIDWLLLYGHSWQIGTHLLRIPSFGVVGSSWATSSARLYLVLFLAVALWRANRKHRYGLGEVSLQAEFDQLAQIFRMGVPIGAQIFVEIAIFALVTSLIASFGPLPLAGHEIALQCASTSFMVPLAISSATSVRVGHALGRVRIGAGTVLEAAAAGWAGIIAGAGLMLISAVCFLSMPRAIAHLFTPDAAVVAAAAPLLSIAACFQFFDGIQITATGAMRGAGHTTTPLWTQIVAYWLVGMPLGYMLGFHAHLGPRGLWMGLAISLSVAAVGLLWAWHRLTGRLGEEVGLRG